MSKVVFRKRQPECNVVTFDGKAYVYIALHPNEVEVAINGLRGNEEASQTYTAYEYDYNEFVTDEATAALVKENPEAYLDYVPLSMKTEAERIADAEQDVSNLSENISVLMDAIAELAAMIGGDEA